jgi:uncharacterized protein DUF1579
MKSIIGNLSMLKFALIAILVFTVNNNYSQEMPQVPDQIKKLYFMEGTWEGNASMTMGSDVSKGTVKHIVSKISEGWGLLIDEYIDIPSMGKPYIGHNILGYHTGEGMFHLYTIDNFADVHDHSGKMTDDKTLSLEYNGLTPDGKKYKEKLTMTIVSSSELNLGGEAIIDGVTAYTFSINEKKGK